MLSCQHLPVNHLNAQNHKYTNAAYCQDALQSPHRRKVPLLGSTICSIVLTLFTILMGKSILMLFKYSFSIQLSQANGNSTAKRLVLVSYSSFYPWH